MSWLILPGDKGLDVPEGGRSSALLLPALSLVGVWGGEEFVSVPRPTISLQRLTAPNRTDVLDSAGQWLATFTDGSRTVRMKRESRIFIEQIPVVGTIRDMFARTFSDGWGNTAESGRWAVRTGANADFSVAGKGVINVTTVNNPRRIAPSSYGYSYPYVNAAVIVSTDKLATGAAQSMSLMGCYGDANNHYLASVNFEPTGAVFDSFQGRVVVNGWGNADTGQLWTVAGGAPSDFAVTSGIGTTAIGYGEHHLTNANVSRRTTIAASNNQEIFSRVYMPSEPSGDSVYGGWMLRYFDIDNYYIAHIEHPVTGNAVLKLQKRVGGVVTTLSSVDLALPHDTNQGWYVRAQIVGSAIKIKAWRDSGFEPVSWTIQVTDTSIVTGAKAGTYSITGPGCTGTFPYIVYYAQMEVTNPDLAGNPVTLVLQKRVGGTVTNLGGPPIPVPGLDRHIITRVALHLQIANGRVKATAYPTTATSIAPSDAIDWMRDVADTTLTTGDVGVQGILNPGYTATLPVKMYFESYGVDTQWVNPPSITHDTWVYIAPTPFVATAFPFDWFYARLYYGEIDVLGYAMQYVSNAATGQVRATQADFRNAPDIGRTSTHRWSGDANYGPLDGTGLRLSGADFNDYIAETAHYGGTDDAPESAEISSLDAAGYVRAVYGIRGGMPMQIGITFPDRIPDTVATISANGPGVVIAAKSTAFVSADLAKIAIGDIVSFDAGTDPVEEEGQIDHDGIYIGTDATGAMRFVSSRKTANGPTFADIGGPAKLTGTGLYARQLRHVRRF